MSRVYLFLLIFLIFVNNLLAISNTRDMILIPKGKYIPLFKYGDELSEDAVSVDSFFIDKYPVTNKNFKEFIKRNSEWSADNISSIFADNDYLSHWLESEFENIKDYPVVNVSWFAANEFCSFLGKRLPTIDEWEYVASASETKAIGKEDPEYLQDVLDWYINHQTRKLFNVKYMKSNYWNVCGMHGVVWELVQDFNSVILLNTDAEGGGLEEVLYCGATATNAIDPADYVAFMRFAFRNSLEANYTMSHLGFRCAKDAN